MTSYSEKLELTPPRTTNKSNNNTPKRPSFPRPSSTNEKLKLQQRITLNHLNSPLSTSSSIISHSHGSNHTNKKGYGIVESSIKEDIDDYDHHDRDENVLQFSSLKLEKYQSTLTIPGIFNTVNNNTSIFNNHDDLYNKSTRNRKSNIEDINENELEFKSHVDVEHKVKTLFGIDEIAQSLALGEIEFCYIQQSKEDPYKFRIINKPSSMTTESYCTVSKNGIVRYTPKGSEYEELNEFMGDLVIFDKLKQLRVFKEYRLWKSMLVWKKGLKERKYMKYKDMLLGKYFLLEDRFQKRIPFVMDRCDELKNIRILNFEIDSEIDIKEFLTMQEESIEKAVKVKNKILNAIINYLTTQIADDNIKIIEKVTETLNKKASHSYSTTSVRRMKKDRDKEIDTKSMTVDFFEPTSSVASNMQPTVSFFDSHSLDQSSMASKSLYANTASNYEANSKYVPEVGLSYTDRANIRVSCRKLASFLRVTDFIIRSALYDAVRSNLQKLYEFMLAIRHDDSKGGLFSIKLMLIQENDNASYISNTSGSNCTVSFDIKPSIDHFMQLFQVFLYKSNMLGCHVKSLITEYFTDSLAPIANEVQELSLLDIINDRSNIISNYCNKSMSLLDQDFTELMAKISKFQYLCTTYMDHVKYIIETTPSSLENMLVEEINELLAATETELSEYSKMQSVYDIGLMRLDLTQVKNLMIQKTNEKLTLLHTIIPIIHNKIEDNFSGELYHLTTTLEKTPESLEEFIMLLEVFNDTTKESERLYAEFSRLTGFYDLFSEFKLPNNDAIMSKYISLSNLWYKYNDTVLEFENMLDVRFKKYRLDLKARVAIFMKPVDEGKVFLNNNLILSPDSDPSLILPELQRLHDMMQNIREESNIIERYQILMQTSVFSIASIRDVIDAISSNFKLWTSVQFMKDVTSTLNTAYFKEIDIGKIIKDLQVVAYNLSIINENFNLIVRAWVADALDELTKIIPILQMLQTKTLQDRHIDRLSDSYGKNIYISNNGRGDTVANLINGKILDYSYLIESLSTQAQYEYNVELKMNEILTSCETKEFEFETDATSGILCISNFVDLKEFLEDNLYWVESCIQSKYAKPHLVDLSTLFTTLKGCLPNLESLRILQLGYIQLRIIFTNARTARNLSHAMKYFQIVDEVWRQVIGITRTKSRIMEIFQNTEIFDKMKYAVNAVDEINKSMDEYIEEQCAQWPKLYLMDRSALVDAITTNDPQESFLKTKSLLPALSHLKLLLDKHGSYVAEGFVSRGNESLNFLTPCSVRSSLADWMKGLENALRERLKFDINQLVDGRVNPFEDLQKPVMSDQGRLVYFQTSFWNLVYQALQSTSRNRAVKPLLQEISDQIFMSTNLINSVSTTYQIVSVANTITLLMYEREFVEKLLDDLDSELPATGFLVENALKKRYISTTSTVMVQQGRFQIPYGFNYAGFGERLILTALTERCWVAMSIAFQNLNIPFVSNTNGQGKRNMVKALSKEIGADTFVVECSLVKNAESLFKAIRSSFASNLFMIFCDTDKLSYEMQSVLFTQLMTTFSAIAGGATQLNIGGQLTDIMPISNGQIPRISILYNLTSKTSDPFLPATIRSIFRPIKMIAPSHKAIFRVLFTAYSYWDISKSTIRLSALCDYITVNKNIDNRVVGSFAIASIKNVGIMMLMKTIVLLNKQQLLRVAQELIKDLVHHYEKHFSDDGLRFICNLFLDYHFKPDQDRLKFRPQKKAPSDILVEFFTNDLSIDSIRPSSIIVVGDVGVGKSSQISSAIDKVALSENRVKAYQDNGLSPFLMTNLSIHRNIAVATAAAMSNIIDKVEAFSLTEIMHLDLHSSNELVYVLKSSETYAETTHKSIKFVWECTELSHIDPSIIDKTQILHVKSKSYTLKEAIARRLQTISTSGNGVLAFTLEQCIETYLMPCLNNVPSDSILSQISLADHVLLMFQDIFNASEMLSRTNDDFSVAITKIFIFSCIWTIGACSLTSQQHFDKWFKVHLKKVFPVSQRSGHLPIPLSFLQDGQLSMIHQYYLEPVEGENILDWVPCSQLQMFIDSASSSDNDLTKRVHMTKLPTHSYSHFYQSNQSSMIVSTHIGEAVSYIQRCILQTGASSSIMLLGSPGTGKSSLIKHLYNDFTGTSKKSRASKFSFKTNANNNSFNFKRWVCLLHDSKHQDIHDYITLARNNISEAIIEERWSDDGVIFIEDVNIRNDFEFSSTCVEWLRTLSQHKKTFDFTRQNWRDCNDIYSVCTANPYRLASSDINKRLIRHSFCVALDETDLTDVFSVKLCYSSPTLHEISEDVVRISFKLLASIKSACHHFLIDSNTSIQEKMFASIIAGQSVPTIVESVLDVFSKSLISLSGFTNYDALRVYDRVISDYFAFLPSIEEVLKKSFASLYHSSQRYKFQGFSDRIKRELDMKEEACQKSETARATRDEFTTEDLDEIKILDKYIAGFSKNGPTYYIGLLGAEYIRENYIQNLETAIPKIISKPSMMREENLGFFMDVQRLAAQVVPVSQDAPNPYTIVTGQDFRYIQQVIRAMTALHPLTFYHCTTIFDKSHIQQFIDEEVDHMSEFLENCNFYLKNRVNMDLSSKSFMRKSGTLNSSRSSFMIAPDDDITINAESFFGRYPTMARIWHVHICPTVDLLEDGDWATLIDIIELKNAILIDKLKQLGLSDIRKNASSRMIINYYLKKQYYFITFGSTRSIMAKTNRFIKNPHLIKKFRFFNLSPSYIYLRNYYKTIFSQSRYLLVDSIIDEMTKVITKAINHQKSHHHHHHDSHHDHHIHHDYHQHDDQNSTDNDDEIIKMVISKDFKMGSLRAIEHLYDISKTYSDANTNSNTNTHDNNINDNTNDTHQGWTNAIMNAMKSISVGARQRHYFALKKKTKTGSPSNKGITIDDDNNNDDDDDLLFFDAVFNVIFSRYVMVLNEERQNGVTQHLIKKFKALNLPRSINFDILPLASVMVISQYQQLPYQSALLDNVVNVARCLPESSSLRRLLSGIGIMLICNCNEGIKSSIVGRFIDRTNAFSALLSDVFGVTCSPQLSSPLYHGSTRVLDIKLNIEGQSNLHPLPLSPSDIWTFVINTNSKCLFELFVVSLMLQGYSINPLLSVAYEKFKTLTSLNDVVSSDPQSELEFDINAEKASFDKFKLASSDFDLQWSLAWKDIEKIVLTINAVLHGITICISKRELPPEYESVFLKNLKINLDSAVASSNDTISTNFKVVLANALHKTIHILKSFLSQQASIFLDVFIFWKLIMGWGDHNYHESNKLLVELCQRLELGIKANVSINNNSELNDETNNPSIFLTKDSHNIIGQLDNFVGNTSRRHSVIGNQNAAASTNALRVITSEEHLHDLSLWVADFPDIDLNTDSSLSLMERFVIGYILKPLSLPQLLSRAISELGQIPNALDDILLQNVNNRIVFNPSGYIDIRNIHRSITSFDIQCYMGITTNVATSTGTKTIFYKEDDILITSNNRNNDTNDGTVKILECMGRSINADVISNYINNNNNSIVETSLIMNLSSDNMNLMTVIHPPTSTNESFLVTLEHALKAVKDIPINIINSNPIDKNITTTKASNEANGEKEKKGLIMMNKKAIRVRWLLAIFHAAFSSRLHAGVDMLIGDDTLICAIKEADQYLSVILSASLSTASTPMSTLLSGINDEVCIEYIVNTLYLSLISDSQQQNVSEAMFRSVFWPSCLDTSTPYYLRGGSLVPEIIDDDSINSFIISVKSSLSERLQLHQLLGCTLSEISAAVSTNIHDSMNCILGTCEEVNNNKYVLTSLPIPVLKIRIKDVISSFVKLLPAVIPVESEDMVKAIDLQGTTNRLNRMDEKSRNSSSKKAALKIKGDILEFDPLFAFLLSECKAYNTLVDDIKSQCDEITSAEFYPLEKLLVLIDLVLIMESGMIPQVWIPSSNSPSMTITSWIDTLIERKSFLESWVLTGFPNLVPFHLLANPSCLLHALKESYAIKVESTPDRVTFSYHWLSVESAATSINTIQKQNLGCSIIISPLTLVNATVSESKQQLSPLQPFYRNDRGQEIALLINANLDYILEGNIFHCPLYVSPAIPLHIKLFTDNNNRKLSYYETERAHLPYLLIPIEVEDQNLSLAGPKLTSG